MSLHTAYGARASNKHLESASCVLGNHTTHWNSAPMNLFAKKTLILFWDISGYTKVQKRQDPLSILGRHNPTLTPSHTSNSSTPMCTAFRVCPHHAGPPGAPVHGPGPPPSSPTQPNAALTRAPCSVSLNTTELKWMLFIHESACVHWRGRAGCTGW